MKIDLSLTPRNPEEKRTQELADWIEEGQLSEVKVNFVYPKPGQGEMGASPEMLELVFNSSVTAYVVRELFESLKTYVHNYKQDKVSLRKGGRTLEIDVEKLQEAKGEIEALQELYEMLEAEAE